MLAAWAIYVLLLVLVAAALWIGRHFLDVYHLATVKDGVLYRDGVRSAREFAVAMRRVRPRTIVSLVDEREISQEPFLGELDFCSQNRIDVVRIPVRLGGWPSSEQISQFLAITTDPSRQPVLVHCAQGVRRTGIMVAAYQQSVLKFNRQQTTAAMLTFGHSQRTVGDVQRFIDLYDPAEMRMTQDLPQSVE
jgi:protein tyrosine/serine phosphatase